jgi:hypothetical protein
VRRAAALGIPIAIVNRGRTRGDDLATVKVDGGCSELLVLLVDFCSPVDLTHLAAVTSGRAETR